MGQYYRSCFLKKGWKKEKNILDFSVESWSFNCGAKLMEHSFCGNPFVGFTCYMLANIYYGYPFVWCGDYADAVKTEAHPDGIELYYEAEKIVDGKKYKDFVVQFSHLYPNDEIPQYSYAVNLTKKEYVKIQKYNKREWRIHPLPLLCCNSNQRGGGDYYGTDVEYVGRWAYDEIGVTNSKKKLVGLTEITPHFKEKGM
jgi:hypothetical protein